FGHVAGDCLRLAAGRAYLCGGVLQAGQGAPAYDRGGAQAGQLDRDGPPDASSPARDKRRLSLQTPMHSFSSWTCAPHAATPIFIEHSLSDGTIFPGLVSNSAGVVGIYGQTIPGVGRKNTAGIVAG